MISQEIIYFLRWFPLIKLAKKLKDEASAKLNLLPQVEFPLIKLAKKLKVVIFGNSHTDGLCDRFEFPLIKLAKKLKESHGAKAFGIAKKFPLIKLAKKLKD